MDFERAECRMQYGTGRASIIGRISREGVFNQPSVKASVTRMGYPITWFRATQEVKAG